MVMYAISTQPLIQALKQQMMMENRYVLSIIALLSDLWKMLKIVSKAKVPDYGYCSKPAKTILIIKNEGLWKYAQKLFNNTGTTNQGECHLGTVIGQNHVGNISSKTRLRIG